MAVYAAHLTRTLQGTPSVFQLTAQEALGATVKPALRKLVEYLASVYPNKCAWSVRWFDELYLLFDTSLQYHYLKHYAASFSESFYGLIRVPTFTSEFSTGQRLPANLEWASLALLVLAPYVRDKLEVLVDKWREDEEDGRLGKSTKDRLRAAAIRVYSISHLASSTFYVYKLAQYIRGSSTTHCPQLALLRLQLKDAPPREDGETWWDLINAIRKGQLDGDSISFPMFGRVLLSCVEYGAFLVQFLRWWESRETNIAVLPIPDPPTKDEKSLRYKNKCPICMQTWKIPTVLPVSGHMESKRNAFCKKFTQTRRSNGNNSTSSTPCNKKRKEQNNTDLQLTDLPLTKLRRVGLTDYLEIRDHEYNLSLRGDTLAPEELQPVHVNSGSDKMSSQLTLAPEELQPVHVNSGSDKMSSQLTLAPEELQPVHVNSGSDKMSSQLTLAPEELQPVHVNSGSDKMSSQLTLAPEELQPVHVNSGSDKISSQLTLAPEELQPVHVNSGSDKMSSQLTLAPEELQPVHVNSGSDKMSFQLTLAPEELQPVHVNSGSDKMSFQLTLAPEELQPVHVNSGSDKMSSQLTLAPEELQPVHVNSGSGKISSQLTLAPKQLQPVHLNSSLVRCHLSSHWVLNSCSLTT